MEADCPSRIPAELHPGKLALGLIRIPMLRLLSGCLNFRRSFQGVLLVLALASAAFGQVAETLGPRIAVFFASEEARLAALPSVALVGSRHGPPGDGGVKLWPSFFYSGGRQIVVLGSEAGCSYYGTGEVVGPLRRNGIVVTLWNNDAYKYNGGTSALYQSHPWVLGVRPDGSAFGVIFDSTYRQVISMPGTGEGIIQAEIDGPPPAVIIIERDTPQAVLQVLADLTGHMPLPPKWSLGYHQCRYSYAPDTRAREIAREFRARRIPCDTLWFDIDYMEDFRIFTFDPGRFPDPARLNGDLHAQGFHTVWMVDPGLKSRDVPSPTPPTPAASSPAAPALAAARARVQGDFRAIREAGDHAGYYVRQADGTYYEGEVWPGLCYFPDFTRADVRAWWGSLYRPFLAQGIDGVWNDMNEPAVFHVPSKTMPLDNLHRADAELGGLGSHARYHNIYGMQMIRATRDGLLAARPDRRPFVLSRANFLGGQRYGAMWTGDNTADWDHLAWSVPMVLNLGLSGQPYAGPDIGGFVGNGPAGDPPLDRGTHFARWMGIGSLLPFARGHTSKENADKEPWSFGPAVEQTCRLALERRYRLMPYLYTVFREASVTGLPVARPVFFAEPKNLALRGEDSAFLLGDALLVACRVTPGLERTPLLPAGWVLFKFSGEPDDPNLPDLYVRPGAIIPTGPVMQFVDEQPLTEVTLLVCLDAKGEAAGTLYEDAGDGFGYQRGDYRVTTYKARRHDGKVELTTAGEGRWTPPDGRSYRIVEVGTP